MGESAEVLFECVNEALEGHLHEIDVIPIDFSESRQKFLPRTPSASSFFFFVKF